MVLAWARRTWPHSQALKAMACLRFEARILPERWDVLGISLWRTVRIPWGLGEKNDFQTLLSKESFLPGNEPGKIKDRLVGDTGDLLHGADSFPTLRGHSALAALEAKRKSQRVWQDMLQRRRAALQCSGLG